MRKANEHERKTYQAFLAEARRLRGKHIDYSDMPEISPEMFAHAVAHQGLLVPARKTQIALRIDGDVLAWFKAQGKGYQSRINALLRAYLEAHR